MKVKSSAGDMDMFVNAVTVEGDDLVMKGKMGVWDATVVVTAEEASKMAGMLLNPKVVSYVLRLPLRRFRKN